MKYKAPLLVVLALLLGVVLGACGRDLTSGGTGSTNTPNVQTTSSTQPTSSGINTNAPVGSGAPVIPALNQTGQSLNPTGNIENDIQNVVKAARPAVVLIAVTIQTTGGGGGIFGGGGGQIEQGVGTGSIITPDGYILTNNHVVEGANTIRVEANGKRYNGKLIGREGSNNDLAVVKIDPQGGETFPTIKFAPANQVQVGEWVVAIGNALGLPGGPSVTAGIVSSIGRSIQEPGGANLTNLVQTDAAINPGNSGGPLLNLKGELVGVNTAAAVNPEENVAAQSIGFAIPVAQAQQYAQAWVSGKQPAAVARPFMGILPQTMTAALAARYNLPTDTGVLIARVDANTPASKAGWKAGDIIIAMDNQQITSTDDLAAVLDKHKPGDTVTTVLVGQNGQQRQTQITFAQAPKQ